MVYGRETNRIRSQQHDNVDFVFCSTSPDHAPYNTQEKVVERRRMAMSTDRSPLLQWCSLSMGLLFAYSATVQLNDPGSIIASNPLRLPPPLYCSFCLRYQLGFFSILYQIGTFGSHFMLLLLVLISCERDSQPGSSIKWLCWTSGLGLSCSSK